MSEPNARFLIRGQPTSHPLHPTPRRSFRLRRNNAPSPWGGPGWGLLAMQEPKSQWPIRGRPTPHVPLPTSRINNPPPACGHFPRGGGLLLSETKLFEHWAAIFFSPSPRGGPGWGLLVMQEPKSQSPMHGQPTSHVPPYVPNKQPPSGGYAAISPKGEVLELVIRQKRRAHYALSSPFQLAQVYDLLGWNDGTDRGDEVDS